MIPAALKPHRIYILPTRSWMILGAVLAAMWYSAISQSNSVAYLLMFFLASLVMVSAIHTHFALAGLAVRVGRIEPVFAGETVGVPLEVVNATRRTKYALQVAPNGRVFKEAFYASLGRLEPAGSQDANLTIPVEKRGWFRLGRVALTTVYPLGFFRAWRYEPSEADCLVYPVPAGRLPLPFAPVLAADAVEGVGAGGDDFSGVRPYQTGESQRHMDWRAVSRGQPLLVKQFSGTGSRRVWLDYAETAVLTGLEARLSQLCRWVVDAEAQGYAYGLRLPGFEAEPSRGPRHRHRCLGALALFDGKNATGPVGA